MKKLNYSLVMFGILLLAACGNKNKINGNGSNLVDYNNDGIPDYASGGCVNINQPISFTANNIYFDNTIMLMGQIPQSAGVSYGQYGGGTVTIGTGGYVGGGGGQYVKNSMEGSLSLSLNGGYGNNQYGTGTNAQGTVTLAEITKQNIWANFGNGGGYNGGNYGYNGAGGPCVSGIAIYAKQNPYYYTILEAYVWLYINNQAHGVMMYL